MGPVTFINNCKGREGEGSNIVLVLIPLHVEIR